MTAHQSADDACIINGTFADLKSVKTRSVVQLIVEVPIEQASQVVAVFGYPQPGNEIAVTVVRFNPDEDLPTADEVKGILKPEKAKKRFEDYSLSQQAGIRCGDEGFREWLKTKGLLDEEMTVPFVRSLCYVTSRSQFDTDKAAGELWTCLNAEYEMYAGLVAEDRS